MRLLELRRERVNTFSAYSILHRAVMHTIYAYKQWKKTEGEIVDTLPTQQMLCW